MKRFHGKLRRFHGLTYSLSVQLTANVAASLSLRACCNAERFAICLICFHILQCLSVLPLWKSQTLLKLPSDNPIHCPVTQKSPQGSGKCYRAALR